MTHRARRGRGAAARILLLPILITLVATGRSRAEGSRVELRFDPLGQAFRWSKLEPLDVPPPDISHEYEHVLPRSYHLRLGLGARYFPRGTHGVYAHAEYLPDMDVDGVMEESSWRMDFALAGVGYAYRHEHARERRHEGRTGAVTLRAGLEAGVARSDWVSDGVPESSPVVGFALAVDYDLVFGPFFMGWSFSYDFLFHTRGTLTRSAFLGWNALPITHFGVSFGPAGRAPAPGPAEGSTAPSAP